MAHQRQHDVTGSVTIPDYPAEKGKPTITVDDQVNYQTVIHQVKQK